MLAGFFNRGAHAGDRFLSFFGPVFADRQRLNCFQFGTVGVLPEAVDVLAHDGQPLVVAFICGLTMREQKHGFVRRVLAEFGNPLVENLCDIWVLLVPSESRKQRSGANL